MASPARRWGIRLLIVSAVLAVCAGIAEVALRMVIPGVVSTAVRSQFPLEPQQEVAVDMGGSALFAALRGTIGNLTVSLPNMSLGDGAVGDVQLTAQSVPFVVTSGEISGGRVTVDVLPEQLGLIAHLVTDGLAENAEIVANELLVSHSISLLGMDVPLSASMRLAAADGEILVTPTRIGAGGLSLTAEQISSLTGSSLDGLLKEHSVCIADQLPQGVTVSEISLSDSGSLKVTAELAPTLLSDTSQQTYGRCEGETSLN